MAEKVLREALEGKTYDDAQAPEMAPALAERVKQAVRGAVVGWSVQTFRISCRLFSSL